MANLTSVININVPTEVKEEANIIFNDLGLNMTTAINIFLKKAIYEKGIPFDVKLTPTESTKKALKELDDMKKNPSNYKKYHDVHEMLNDILDE